MTGDVAAASLPAMAHTGQIIQNPVSGERITFLQTSHDTGGERLEIELELAPDGHVPGAHVHPEQEERFHVLEGEMKFRLGTRKIVAGPGETVVVPAGRVHRFANNGDGVARARVEVVPALDMEQLFETTVELALEGNTTRKGMPKPLHLALFVDRFRREVRAPFPPAAIVRALMAPLAALARRRGHAERYVPTAEVVAFPAPLEAEVALAA
jgi:quercetin dioxygenase-like cupin family protein